MEEIELTLDAEIDIGTPLDLPSEPQEAKDVEEDFFVVVEQMPKLKGGLKNFKVA